jgi:hypothetical protein
MATAFECRRAGGRRRANEVEWQVAGARASGAPGEARVVGREHGIGQDREQSIGRRPVFCRRTQHGHDRRRWKLDDFVPHDQRLGRGT